ncbi:hypothetical protein [Achromobacter sp. 77]|uniref:hypothetical protein n=1 Tax=Achromobacter sp. 77 TaxID=2756133 RepID=UPI001D007128|nr:hypothetical protein [Achromobacter sp. 77]
MCSHYQTLKDAELLLKKFGVTRPGVLGKYDMWPRYQGIFIRQPPEHDAGDEAVPSMEVVTGRRGLISGSTRPDASAGAEKLWTFNARDVRVANVFTFRNARCRHNARLPPQANNHPLVAFAECICVHHIKQRGA